MDTFFLADWNMTSPLGTSLFALYSLRHWRSARFPEPQPRKLHGRYQPAQCLALFYSLQLGPFVASPTPYHVIVMSLDRVDCDLWLEWSSVAQLFIQPCHDLIGIGRSTQHTGLAWTSGIRVPPPGAACGVVSPGPVRATTLVCVHTVL